MQVSETTVNKNGFKTPIKLLIGEKQPIINELWVVYGFISRFCPNKTHISYTFRRQTIYNMYHGYSYAYLMLTNFIGNSYMSDLFAKVLPI